MIAGESYRFVVTDDENTNHVLVGRLVWVNHDRHTAFLLVPDASPHFHEVPVEDILHLENPGRALLARPGQGAIHLPG